MGLIQSIKSILSRPTTGSALGFMNGVMNGAKARPYNYDAALREFHSWVYAAAALNANAVASLPIRLYVKDAPVGKKALWKTRSISTRRRAYLLGDPIGSGGLGAGATPCSQVLNKMARWSGACNEVTEGHPALTLLQSANPWQSGHEMLSLMTLYLELIGNAYLLPVLNPATNLPAELWTLPAQWVTIKPGTTAGSPFVQGYRYGKNSADAVDFGAREVLHFKRANPRDPYYGLGKVEAGWGAICLNDSHHAMDLAFADNMARPDFVAIIKGATGTDQLDRFEASVERKLRGANNHGRFLTIAGDVELKRLNFPPRDLGGREDIVEEIGAIFGVPVSMLKANDPNLASARVGYNIWREQTIAPICRLIEETLNTSFAPLWGEEFADNAVFAFDNPIPKDDRFILDREVQLVQAGIMTIDEARAEQGLGAR